MDEPIQPEQQPTVAPQPPVVTPAPIEEPPQSAAPQAPEQPGVEVLESDNSTKSFSWQASEFIHHQKRAGWYVIFVIVVIALVAVAVITHQWFSVAVFIAMAAALTVYARKEPRVLQYQLDNTGIQIEQKHYPFSNFRSFAVFNDVAWHAIDFDPTQRFMPRLTVYFETKDLDTITQILSAHLPHVDRQPDLVEQITRNLKF